MQLNNVVPWGRSLEEYVGMFDLSSEDLGGRLLDCAGGPASFSAELSRSGGRVVSCDPIYTFSGEELARRIAETYPVIVAGMEAARDRYVWDRLGSPEAVGEVRMRAMDRFLADYPEGLREGRYVAAALPRLPFKERSFDLALCSHLLFTYSEHLTLEFHLESVIELCRVASEARIFPLLNLNGDPSPHLDPLLAELAWKGHDTEVVRVGYEFQAGGNRMLRVRSPKSQPDENSCRPDT